MGTVSVCPPSREIFAVPLVLCKKERLVANDGSADRRSKQVEVRDAARLTLSISEEIVGPQPVVAEELIERAVKRIGARLCDHVDHPAAAPAKLRTKAVRHYLKLRRTVGCRRDGKVVVLGKHDRNAIQHEIVAAKPAAIDGDVGKHEQRRRIVARRSHNSEAARVDLDARCERHEIEDVAAFDGQFLNASSRR